MKPKIKSERKRGIENNHIKKKKNASKKLQRQQRGKKDQRVAGNGDNDLREKKKGNCPEKTGDLQKKGQIRDRKGPSSSKPEGAPEFAPEARGRGKDSTRRGTSVKGGVMGGAENTRTGKQLLSRKNRRWFSWRKDSH